MPGSPKGAPAPALAALPGTAREEWNGRGLVVMTVLVSSNIERGLVVMTSAGGDE